MSPPLKKQSSRNSVFNNSVYVGVFGEDEIGVSEILIDLPTLISDSKRRRQYPPFWGKKGRRSALVSPPPSCRQQEKEKVVLKIKKKKKHKNVETAVFAAAAAGRATSPSTPLTFYPSESDEQPNSSSKQSIKSNSKKRLSHGKKMEKKAQPQLGVNVHKMTMFAPPQLRFAAYESQINGKKIEKKNPQQPQLGMNNVHQMTMFAPPPQQHQFAAYEFGNFQYLHGQRIPMGISPCYWMTLVNLMGSHGIPDLNVCAGDGQK